MTATYVTTTFTPLHDRILVETDAPAGLVKVLGPTSP